MLIGGVVIVTLYGAAIFVRYAIIGRRLQR
jgi:hypothetical protein